MAIPKATRSPLSRRAPPLVLAAALLAGQGCFLVQDPLSFRFSPGRVDVEFLQGDEVPYTDVEAVLSHPLGAGTQPALVDDALILRGSEVNGGGDSLTLHLRPYCGLEPGVYEGAFRVELRDYHAIGSEYDLFPTANDTLPYRVVVRPGPMLRVSVEGSPEGLSSACDYLRPDARVGQVVSVTSGIPVTWSVEYRNEYGVPTVSDVATTDTTWTATVGSEGGTGEIGTIQVKATPIEPVTRAPYNLALISVHAP